MVNRLIVKDLFGVKGNDFDLAFNPDLNILTGKNGVGKTTILKLIWLILSDGRSLSKMEDGIPSFSYLRVEYDDEASQIQTFIRNDNPEKEEFKAGEFGSPPKFQTIFMPTFRRIEGRFPSKLIPWVKDIPLNDVNKNHLFVVNATTSDIVSLVTQRFAELHSEAEKIEDEASTFILKVTQAQPSGSTQLSEKEIIERIVEHQQKTKIKKEEILKPLTIFSETVRDFINEKGIDLTSSFSLEGLNKGISSEHLSSGEKQILSFLAYSILFKNSVIFIDEPELSLHADWQRLLFPTLLDLAPTNQFFIASHSPFIYSKYPDKEIMLDKDKGGE